MPLLVGFDVGISHVGVRIEADTWGNNYLELEPGTSVAITIQMLPAVADQASNQYHEIYCITACDSNDGDVTHVLDARHTNARYADPHVPIDGYGCG